MCKLKNSIKVRTRQASWRTLRCSHARQPFDSQLRLQADDVRQTFSEQVAHLGMHRGNSPEDETAYGEQHCLEDTCHLEDLGAEAVMVSHVFQKTSPTHLFLPQAQAELVVLGVEVEVAHHQTEACETTPTREIESPMEDRGNHEVWVVDVVDARRRKDDSEVGWKEVSFEETMIQRQEVRLIDRFGRDALGFGEPWDERFV